MRTSGPVTVQAVSDKITSAAKLPIPSDLFITKSGVNKTAVVRHCDEWDRLPQVTGSRFLRLAGQLKSCGLLYEETFARK